MKHFKKIFLFCCLSVLMNSGKVDAKIVPYIDGIRDILIGTLACTTGYKIKNFSSKIEEGRELFKKTKEQIPIALQYRPIWDLSSTKIEDTLEYLSTKTNIFGNILLGIGIGENGLGLLRIVEELVDGKEKEQKPQLVIRPNLYKY